jgi:hypothetical protein
VPATQTRPAAASAGRVDREADEGLIPSGEAAAASGSLSIMPAIRYGGS